MVRKSYIDDIDIEILKMLEENARIPYTEIAKKLNLSEVAVRKRIKKLERMKIILKYTIVINYKDLGLNLAWIGVDTKPDKLFKVIEDIKELKNIRNIYTTTGDHNIILEILYENQNELRELVKKLESIDGIIRVCPAILVEKI